MGRRDLEWRRRSSLHPETCHLLRQGAHVLRNILSNRSYPDVVIDTDSDC